VSDIALADYDNPRTGLKRSLQHSTSSFANPAVTIARMFSDSFAGIAPSSVPPFLIAQLVGGVVGCAIVRYLYPSSIPLPNPKERHDHGREVSGPGYLRP
jgi:glycerol uptake facilitator-like aquaporin